MTPSPGFLHLAWTQFNEENHEKKYKIIRAGILIFSFNFNLYLMALKCAFPMGSQKSYPHPTPNFLP